jgi:hypothetical protein
MKTTKIHTTAAPRPNRPPSTFALPGDVDGAGQPGQAPESSRDTAWGVYDDTYGEWMMKLDGRYHGGVKNLSYAGTTNEKTANRVAAQINKLVPDRTFGNRPDGQELKPRQCRAVQITFTARL